MKFAGVLSSSFQNELISYLKLFKIQGLNYIFFSINILEVVVIQGGPEYVP